jgi:PAS domain-containing protein
MTEPLPLQTIQDLRVKNLPFLRADQEGIIEEVNEAFITVYGWAADDLVGESLSLILPDFFRDAHHLGFSRFRITEGVGSEVLNHPLKLRLVLPLPHRLWRVRKMPRSVRPRRSRRWLLGTSLH